MPPYRKLYQLLRRALHSGAFATGHAMLGIGIGIGEATITQADRKQGSSDLSVYMLTAGGS